MSHSIILLSCDLGAGCQHCHGRAPAPYMMPAPVFMMPQQGYVPSSTKSSGRREAPRRGRPSLYPRPETSFPGSNSPPLETPGPIPEGDDRILLFLYKYFEVAIICFTYSERLRFPAFICSPVGFLIPL